MKNKKWIRIFMIFTLLSISSVGMFNYIIDPLWIFSHKNHFNHVQESFNERQQKINKISFNRFKEYDSLLLGSSRTTYINQNDFYKMKVFNMGAGNMFPEEYQGFINGIKKIKGQDLKYIIIGMDFFASRIPEEKVKHQKAISYFNKSKELFYKYKMLFSRDTLKYSVQNLLNVINLPNVYYTRDNVRIHQLLDNKKRKENFNITLKKHIDIFKNHYKYNNNLLSAFQKIKKDNPNTQFIIYTTPATAKLLKSTLIDCERFDDYSHWLYDIVNVFGKVYHFYDFNSITQNEKNYPDDEHYYPYIGKMIAEKISSSPNNRAPKDFGMILFENNIENYLNILKQELKNIENE